MKINFVAPCRQDGRYMVTSEGAVWSCRSGIWLRPGLSSNGYVTVSLASKSYCVQYLVAAAFITGVGLVLHRNDVRDDNRLDNLYYGTRSDNQHDRTRNQRGRKFSHEQIRNIRWRRANGETIVVLGKAFGCAHNQISYICSRKQYDSVD